jgi:hypothetical protein
VAAATAAALLPFSLETKACVCERMRYKHVHGMCCEGHNRPRLAGAVVVTDGLVVTCLSCTKVDLLLYAQ